MEIVQPGGSGGSGATLTAETPVGTVNGVNRVFTVAHDPLFVIIDSAFRVDGQGYSYSSPTITTNALTPPVQFITSYYNA